MPTPCTNCVRFHYGQCYEAIKYCRVCGGINHIERYCPNNQNTIHRIRGEPLAGTRPWQELHGLQHDPVLRNKVLQTLKTSPGTAIHVNGVCIYRGHEKHFVKEEPRGRTLEERIGRRNRSRSPSYSRLSRSPQRHNKSKGEPPMRRSVQNYRQRSPIHRERRRTPSPYRHASPPSFYHPQPRVVPKSPRPVSGNTTFVYGAQEASEHYQSNTNIGASGTSTIVSTNNDRLGYLPDAPSTQRELREISGNIQTFAAPTKTQQNLRSTSPALAGDTIIDDPWFVLGVTKSAGDRTIMDAYHARIREVETERALELDIDVELNNDYNNSVHILNAAKNQLLGVRSGVIY